MPIDLITPFRTGFEVGSIKRQRSRKNALADIIGKAYQPGTPEQVFDTGRAPAVPGRFNIKNAFQELAQKGFGPEALQLQQAEEERELRNLLLAQKSKPKLSAPKPGIVNGKEGFFRTDDSGNVFDLNGNEITDVIPRPQRPLVEIGTRGYDKADEEFAKEHIKWKTGAFADTQKSIAQLKDALNRIRTSPKPLTGPQVGNVPDVALQFTNPEAIAVREAIEEVVQRNLRIILGAQFTEKEGERLIARAYNPKLDPQENISRVERLIAQIERAAIAKQKLSEYFDLHGTTKGFQGEIPSLADFYKVLESEKPKSSKRKVGDIVNTKDGLMVITGINEDGSYEARPQ